MKVFYLILFCLNSTKTRKSVAERETEREKERKRERKIEREREREKASASGNGLLTDFCFAFRLLGFGSAAINKFELEAGDRWPPSPWPTWWDGDRGRQSKIWWNTFHTFPSAVSSIHHVLLLHFFRGFFSFSLSLFFFTFFFKRNGGGGVCWSADSPHLVIR